MKICRSMQSTNLNFFVINSLFHQIKRGSHDNFDKIYNFFHIILNMIVWIIYIVHHNFNEFRIATNISKHSTAIPLSPERWHKTSNCIEYKKQYSYRYDYCAICWPFRAISKLYAMHVSCYKFKVCKHFLIRDVHVT